MRLEQVGVRIDGRTLLQDIDWHMATGESWTLLGTLGSGKSTLAQLLAEDVPGLTGTIDRQGRRAHWVSLESQQALYERELYRDDTDLSDRIDHGTPVIELLHEISTDTAAVSSVIEALQLTPLLERGYRLLSTGEGRRVMLARALLTQPELLILDEPFEGLDAKSCALLQNLLQKLADEGHSLLVAVSQWGDRLTGDHPIAVLDHGHLKFQGNDQATAERLWHGLQQPLETVALPEALATAQLAEWQTEYPLVALSNGSVSYQEVVQFEDFHWEINAGDHTQIRGPNGCGKSTLLNLITGDHPQCYRNDLRVFGYQRGRGETIWDIKKHLGYVSGHLHRDYRAGGTLLSVVVSGFHDSIGVYQAVGDAEREQADVWLKAMGLAERHNEPFRSLSMGEQRLVLIARALVKQPPLLILDEPTQGLDDAHRFYVLAMVERLISQSASTLLFVSHRADERLPMVKHHLNFEPTESDRVRFRITQSNSAPV